MKNACAVVSVITLLVCVACADDASGSQRLAAEARFDTRDSTAELRAIETGMCAHIIASYPGWRIAQECRDILAGR